MRVSKQRTWRQAGWAVVAITLCGVLGGQIAAADKPLAASQDYAKQLSSAFRHAAHEALPSVVSIRTVTRAPAAREGGPSVPQENPFKGTPFEDFFGDMFRDQGGLHRFEMPRRFRAGMGSGIVVDATGIILTNNHVVGDGEKENVEITVRLLDGREFPATKVKTDPRTDLAVVWIKGPPDLKAAQLGDSDRLDIGDWVLAIGHPFGLFESVTAGIISAKGRGPGIALREDFLQTDAAINPGNSGGPLVNLDGQVVGINTAISTSTGGYQGAGFAIPINLAKWVMRQLIETGSVRRAYLGTGISPVTQQLSEQFGVPVGGGAVVTEVFKGSPAAKAGLKAGDIVVEFSGRKISKPRDLQAAVERSKVDSRQTMVIVRNGKRMKLQVEVKPLPKDYGIAQHNVPGVREPSARMTYDKLGLEVGPVTEEDAQRLGLEKAQGVVITGVERGSPAALAGLTPGMIITQADRKTVRSVADFDKILKQRPADKKGLLLLVRTGRGSRFVVIQIQIGK